MATIYITTTYTIEHRPYPGSRVAAEQPRMGMNYKAACEHLAMRGVEVGGRYRSVGAREHAYDPRTDMSGDWHGGDDGVYRVTRIESRPAASTVEVDDREYEEMEWNTRFGIV